MTVTHRRSQFRAAISALAVIAIAALARAGAQASPIR